MPHLSAQVVAASSDEADATWLRSHDKDISERHVCIASENLLKFPVCMREGLAKTRQPSAKRVELGFCQSDGLHMARISYRIMNSNFDMD